MVILRQLRFWTWFAHPVDLLCNLTYHPPSTYLEGFSQLIRRRTISNVIFVLSSLLVAFWYRSFCSITIWRNRLFPGWVILDPRPQMMSSGLGSWTISPRGGLVSMFCSTLWSSLPTTDSSFSRPLASVDDIFLCVLTSRTPRICCFETQCGDSRSRSDGSMFDQSTTCSSTKTDSQRSFW